MKSMDQLSSTPTATGRSVRLRHDTCRLGFFVLSIRPSWLYSLAVEPVDPLVVGRPALPWQEDVETPVAVAYPGLGQVPDLHPEGSLLICHAPVAVAGPGQAQHSSAPAFAHAESDLQVLRPGPQLSRLQGFFSQDILQHLLVRAQVGHQLPELAVLLLEARRRLTSATPML